MAGEGEEHLVQAGLAEGELADRDAVPGQPGQRGGDLRRGRRTRAPARPECGRVGPGLDGDAEQPGQICRARGRCAGSASLTRTVPAPMPAFSSPRCPLGDDPAVVDDGDPAGELIGLVEVLGGKQHGRAAGGDGRG